eukprot:1159829-Pelagomonas_calceolata.AAC.2
MATRKLMEGDSRQRNQQELKACTSRKQQAFKPCKDVDKPTACPRFSTAPLCYLSVHTCPAAITPAAPDPAAAADAIGVYLKSMLEDACQMVPTLKGGWHLSQPEGCKPRAC